MPKQNDYRERLEQELGGLIDVIDLSDLQNRFLRSCWLDQIVWMEGKADRARDWYYRLRLMTIIGGVIIPALVSLRIGGATASVIYRITFGLSLAVAISAAVEEFFHHGERWRHYRRTVELLKIEGWQFFQKSGPYRDYDSHVEAYPAFAARVENVIQRDVEVYITEVVREKEEKDEKNGNAASKS